MRAPTAASLVVANEVLGGRIADGNSPLLARVLRGVGIELRRIVVVPDEVDAIATAVNDLRATWDFVFVSGGIGPTHDDVTMEALGRALGRPLRRSPEVEALIRAFYGQACSDAHLRMADLVEGTELVENPEIDTWPAFLVANVFVFPGVPDLYATKLRIVRPRLSSDARPIVLRSVYARGDEGALMPLLERVVARFPEVAIGSYPKFDHPEYGVRVTFECREPSRVDAALEALVELLPEAVFVRAE